MNTPGHGRTPKNLIATLAALVVFICVIVVTFHQLLGTAEPEEASTSAGMPPPSREAGHAAPDVPGTAAPDRSGPPDRGAAPGATATPAERRPSAPRAGAATPKPSSSACSETDVAERDPSCLFRDSGTSPSDSASIQELAAVRAVSERLDALVAGSVGISAPTEVLEYDTFSLILRISVGNIDTVLDSLRQDFPQNKTIVGGTMKLASRMTAQVRGEGLEVYPAGEVSQAISLQEPTTWRWQAKANRTGVVTMTFTVVATPVIEGTEYPRNYYFERNVRVKVTPIGFVKQHWQWFASSIFIPVAIAAFAWMRRAKNAKAQSVRKARRRRPT